MASGIPSSRKVAVCVDPHHIAIQERPTPQPQGTEVLLQIEASGICAGDLHLARRSIPYLQPSVDVCGHEGVGRIIALGPNVDTGRWKVGDRVGHRWIYRVCGQCEMCLGGNEQLCDQRQLSGKDVEGCWAEYTVVDSDYLVRIPDNVSSNEAAPILCAGTTVYHALNTAGLSSKQWVAVVGAGGGLGHLAIQYAKAMGLTVLAIDGGSPKGEFCTRLGAAAYVDFTQTKDLSAEVIRITEGGAHAVLVVSSSVSAYEQAVTYVRKRGIIVCIGVTPTKMHLPVGPEYFVAKAVRITGSSTGSMLDTLEALEYLRDGRVKPMIVEKRLEDILACLDALERGDVMGRFVATFS